MLANLMETKVDIACGYHKLSKDEVQAFWEVVTKTLNSMGPPTKDASAWKKVWIDWKCYIKRKLTANKKEMNSTGGGQCRLQRISPIEEKVIQLTALVTNTSGIRGGVDFGVCSEIREETLASEMDISAMDISSRMEDSTDKASTSKKRQQGPKECTSLLLKEQINSQKEFYKDMKTFNEAILEKYDEMSTHLRRINRSMEIITDIAANLVKEEERHNKIKEELLKKKVEIKLRMLKLEHPSYDSD